MVYNPPYNPPFSGSNSGAKFNNLLVLHTDAPLRYGTAPRVGETIQSALEYCYGLLESGGTCERTLPSTYSVWKKSSDEQCYGAEFNKYVYAHPNNEITTKSMLTVDYDACTDYSRASGTVLFLVFKGIIILCFFLAMFKEVKDIAVCFIWVLKYPAADSRTPEVKEEEDDSGETKYVIQAASSSHRVIVGLMTLARFGCVVVLVVVGFTFLAQDTDWVNLVLNGVALVFVVDIAGNLFAQILDAEERSHFGDLEPMVVPQVCGRYLNARPALSDLLGLMSVTYMLVALMYMYMVTVDTPLSAALQCACLTEGENCREANNFDHNFWEKYWRFEVPMLLDEIDGMQSTYDGNPTPTGSSNVSLLELSNYIYDYDYENYETDWENY